MGRPNPRLMTLLKRISQHYFNEAEIIKDLFKADLQAEDWKLIGDFCKTHPYASLANYLERVHSQENGQMVLNEVTAT